ncbi:hypothetical protein ACGFNP_34685 [Nonomuraea sp. NPDC049269]|uniref:hypothetical protein n=1 Tax=Nonomuraea sp. NPDC049269 TaxID=3364349 RepID=UPI0037113C7D
MRVGGRPARPSPARPSDCPRLHTLDGEGVLRDMSVGPEATAATICARAGRGLTRADWQRHLPGVPYLEVCP